MIVGLSIECVLSPLQEEPELEKAMGPLPRSWQVAVHLESSHGIGRVTTRLHRLLLLGQQALFIHICTPILFGLQQAQSRPRASCLTREAWVVEGDWEGGEHRRLHPPLQHQEVVLAAI